MLSAAAMREIVESVVIAFVLAFLFRTFEAEAFVIPTGSMAPTLMGRHKDLVCEKCGYPFQVSASDEVEPGTNRPNGDAVLACICPMCRYPMDWGKNRGGTKYRSYKGDRILVGKFPYQFGEPQRWDVAVFKYPGGAKTNFIKRIVGLPGETIRITHGDVFVKENGGDGFKIARKSAKKVRAMMQPVYDNDYVQKEIIDGIWPARWSPRSGAAGTAGDWASSEDYKSYRTDGTAGEEVWLGYRHVVPSCEDWAWLREGKPVPGDSARPQLITDFNPYNTEVLRSIYHPGRAFNAPSADKLGLHWVGDLAVECALEVESEGGEAILELVEGGRHFQCRIDVASGVATLSIDGEEGFRPTATTPVRGPGTYRLFFANFDDQLLLLVDGREVSFDSPTTYGPLGNTRPTVDDLQPVSIGSRGAGLTVGRLKVFRDIYYISQQLGPGQSSLGPISDFKQLPYRPLTRREVARVLSNPQEWVAFGAVRAPVEFTLKKDQFLVLGDNSAESKDSRLWAAEGFDYFVNRDLLIGKALVIYWPHSLDRIPGTQIPIRFFPNFRRMWVVR